MPGTRVAEAERQLRRHRRAHGRLLVAWTRATRTPGGPPQDGRGRHPMRTAIDESAAHVHASERQLAEAVAAEVRDQLLSAAPVADGTRGAFWLTTVARDALNRLAQRSGGSSDAVA